MDTTEPYAVDVTTSRKESDTGFQGNSLGKSGDFKLSGGHVQPPS